MKLRLAALVLLASLVLGLTGLREKARSFETTVGSSVGAIFVPGENGQAQFHCSGTEIASSNGEGYFLTARHCVADPETDKIARVMIVSFSDNQKGPFYTAHPVAISLTDDLALLELVNGADVPTVAVKSEKWLKSGDPIFNVSFPLGTGKERFHGEFMQSRFPSLPAEYLDKYTAWANAMPMNLTIAHGSSGSGVFSNREHALIGVAVGTFQEGSYNIAIPGSRVIAFLTHLSDNTLAKYAESHPERAASAWF